MRNIAHAIVDHAALLAKGMRARDAGRVMRGAHAYLHAAVTGEIADPDDRAQQLAACGACASRVDITVRGKAASYCGEPFVDAMDADPPTCGCPVAGIALLPPSVKSCPQGKGPKLKAFG